ncbi:MAG: long-chain-fatty-acid--CoA ligase [Actinomycetota bacterium]|nr:long-chain-fatty-acid--CoA ligase [Actinomycetota bacterium]
MKSLDSLEENLLRRANIGDVLRRSAEHYPERLAVTFGGKSLTFKQLNEMSCRCANSLLEMGINKGDRVALMTHNCPHYIACWMGLAKIGAVTTPLNFMLKGPEVEYIVNHAGPKAFFVEDSLVGVVQEVSGKLKSIQHFGMISLGKGEKPEGWLDVEQLFTDGKDASEPEVEAGDEEIATLMYTSGTEALPKGVMNSHLNFFHSISSGVIDLEIYRDDVILVPIPLYHIAAKYLLMLCMNICAHVVLEYAPNPVEILDLTQKERISYWIFPPTLYQALLAIPDFESYDVSSVKKCICFGSYMPRALLEKWRKILPDSRWRNYYGQTESTPMGSTLQPDKFDEKIESIGKPHTNVLIRIFNDGDEELPVGEVGEIVMRSPSVMLGYYENEEKTAVTLKGGWLHTGDLGRFDEDGYLYFIDRKKDIIKTGGENVSSLEVEGVISKHEKVMQTAVIGLRDEYWGEAVTAVVVPKPGVVLEPEEVIIYCKEKLAGYKVPKRIFVEQDMPISPSGKILKRLLRERYTSSG